MKVRILPADVEVEAEEGELLSAVVNRVMVLPLPCGGAGYCGGCAVRVIEGKVTPPSREEQLIGIMDRGLRLACRTRVLGDAVIEVPSIAPVATVSGMMPRFELKPLIRRSNSGDMALPRSLPKPSLSFRGIAFRSGDGDGEVGLAVDLGTTNISGSLLDLRSGRPLMEGFIRNPQVSRGADVVTRMEKALEGRGEELKDLAIQGIEDLALKLCRASGIREEDISVISVVGNSVMHALLLGLPVEPLSAAPFEPPLRMWVSGPAEEAGFKKLTESWLLIPPPLAGFVGSDALSDLIVAEMLGLERPYLLIDLGTNTEVILVANDMLVTSAPAGSAFESNVPSGVGGVRGAINKVEIRDGEIKVEVEGRPLGLSGSGLISTVAEMLRRGLLSENGRMSRELEGRLRLVDSPKIEMTRRDVREVQKAVAAVYSAWNILMRRENLRYNDLKGVYLAGTFGSHVDPMDAIEVGLIPPVEPEIVVSLGNMALSGAKLLILSEDVFNRFNKLYSAVVHVDLARDPEFSEAFIEGTYLRRRYPF